jgi:hypothetical protein
LGGGVVNVHCVCAPEVAAERFLRRQRHAGHLDIERPYEDVLRSLRAIAELGVLPCAVRVEVGTSRPVDVDMLARDVRKRYSS